MLFRGASWGGEQSSSRNAEHARHLVEPRGCNSVDALLVFLDLLERDAEPLGKLFLLQALPLAAHPEYGVLEQGRFRLYVLPFQFRLVVRQVQLSFKPMLLSSDDR